MVSREVLVKEQEYRWKQRRRRVSEIIEMRSYDDWISRGYNILSGFMLLLNLTVTIIHLQPYGAAVRRRAFAG